MEKSKPNKIDWKQDLITLGLIIAISFAQALFINGFYVPHSFLSGGITGVSLLVDYALNIPSWAVIIVLNIPVAIMGLKFLNLKFMIFSLMGTVIFAFAIAVTKWFTLDIKDPIVAAVIGGAIIGISGAPVIKRGASLGGTDVLSIILSRKFSMPIGVFNIIFNIVIMGVWGAIRGVEIALLSIIAMFVSNMAFNAALQGLNRTVTVFIISDKWEEIAPLLLSELKRGVTYIPAEGAYTGAPKKLVYCIVRTVEVGKIKHIIRDNDPKALFSIIETKEVLGRGFGSLI